MRIWVYAVCRNEKPIMGYFLRHYSTFAEKIIIYDDQSDDGTREIIQQCNKAELRDWYGTHGIVDDEFLVFSNEQWKEARGHADWVIVVDCDEFVFHPNLTELLRGYLQDGVEVPQIDGYTMVSDHFPTTDGQIYDEIRTGFPDGPWSKKAVFRVHMYYNVGRHSINFSMFNPKSSPTAEIKLLHYRCLGMDYLKWRHSRNWARVPEHCRSANYGANCSPGWSDHHGVEWFQDALSKFGSSYVI